MLRKTTISTLFFVLPSVLTFQMLIKVYKYIKNPRKTKQKTNTVLEQFFLFTFTPLRQKVPIIHTRMFSKRYQSSSRQQRRIPVQARCQQDTAYKLFPTSVPSWQLFSSLTYTTIMWFIIMLLTQHYVLTAAQFVTITSNVAPSMHVEHL